MTSECPDCGAQVKKDLSVRVHQCFECDSIKPRDIASSQVICNRGISTLGHSGIENACGVEVAGVSLTTSSQLALKQEIFGATQRISN